MTLTRMLRVMVVCIAGLPGWAAGQQDTPPENERVDPGSPYHWAVKSRTAAPGDADDYQAAIDVTGTAFVRDTMLLYSCQCGNFPFNGPQEALANVNPTWMDDHLAQIPKHLDMFVPDVNFSGLIVIDYEDWDLLWDRTDEKFKEAWKAYAGVKNESMYRVGYEAAARAFYEATIKRVKELRPVARVGFFAYPVKFYLAAAETSPGVIGYGDGEYTASDRNATLGWLWEIEDFLAPNVYCLFEAVDDPDADLFQNKPEKDMEYIRSNTAEAIRLANGKPVYDVISYEYQRSGENRLAGVFLNQLNIEQHLIMTRAFGASGVILWGRAETEERTAELNDYFNDIIVPLLPPYGFDDGEGPCTVDLDANGVLDLFDFLAFVNLFNAADPAADCDASGTFSLFDFLCFTNSFNKGC